jgi:hypothetical protein
MSPSNEERPRRHHLGRDREGEAEQLQRRPGNAPAFFIYVDDSQESAMRTHRFGRKIKLPATTAIKHQIRMRMAQYEIKKRAAEAKAQHPGEDLRVK